jgi:ABC-2 type transport system ATP-binding protein
MIDIKNLTVLYDRKPALSHLHCELTTGRIHGFAGLNGSGKTSLLNAIAGCPGPDAGEIRMDGRPLERRQLSYVETQSYFYSNITGNEYLSLFPSPGKFALALWQELFHLPLKDLISTYSVGMKKKLALLAAFKLNKPLLILDEPFNGLDIESIHILKKSLTGFKEQGKTILLTSHLFHTLSDVCNAIHYLNGKAIQASYEKKDFESLEHILEESIKTRTDQLVDDAIKPVNS